MALEKTKAIERSVDSVARIYAIVIGLALSEAIKTLIVKDPNGNMGTMTQIWAGGGPAFIAFVVTLVPFWHGMNRHLDRSYLEKTEGVVEGALLLDFAVFFLESSLFLIAGWGLRSDLVTYYCLLGVFALDVVWGGVSHLIHFRGQKSHATSWSAINIGAIILMLGVINYAFDQKPLVLMVLAIVRTVVDYWNGREFYFPTPATDAPTPAPPEQK